TRSTHLSLHDALPISSGRPVRAKDELFRSFDRLLRRGLTALWTTKREFRSRSVVKPFESLASRRYQGRSPWLVWLLIVDLPAERSEEHTSELQSRENL